MQGAAARHRLLTCAWDPSHVHQRQQRRRSPCCVLERGVRRHSASEVSPPGTGARVSERCNYVRAGTAQKRRHFSLSTPAVAGAACALCSRVLLLPRAERVRRVVDLLLTAQIPHGVDVGAQPLPFNSGDSSTVSSSSTLVAHIASFLCPRYHFASASNTAYVCCCPTSPVTFETVPVRLCN